MLLLFAFLFCGYVFAIQKRAVVEANDQTTVAERMNLFPGAYEIDPNDHALPWQNVGNAFVNELSDSAGLSEFNQENSAFIVSGTSTESKDSTQEKDSSQPTNTPVTSETAQPTSGQTVEPSNSASPSQNTINTVVPKSDVSPPVTEIPTEPPATETPTESVTQPSQAPAEQPTASPAPAAESTPVSEASPSVSLVDQLKLFFTQAASTLAILPIARAEVSPSSAETASVAEPIKYVSHSLLFKEFGLPADSEPGAITNTQLRLSIAGQAKQNDRLKIEFRTVGEWQEAGDLPLESPVSNQLNNGYLLYAMPVFASWAELKNLQVKVSYLEALPQSETPSKIFLDGAWLEIDYAKPVDQQLEKPEEKLLPKVDNPNFSLELVSQQDSFKLEERPDFNFLYQRKTGLMGQLWAGVAGVFVDQYKGVTFTTRVKDVQGKEVMVASEVTYVNDGEFHVGFNGLPPFAKPGKYTLEIEIKDGENTYLTTQDFSWGVLAINTNKSIYTPGQAAYLQMAVLDDYGSTICDADLFLEITAPDGGVAYLDTANGLVERNPLCGQNNVIDSPDYFAHYTVGPVGQYQVKLLARTAAGIRSITDTFMVEASETKIYDVERVGPTRIFPVANYPMKLIITANQTSTEPIIETVPGSFQIAEQSIMKNGQPLVAGADYAYLASDVEAVKQLTWSGVTMYPGDTLEITYTFDAPDISPEFYFLGPLTIGQFAEARKWQIAADAVVATINASGGTSVGAGWATIGNAWDSNTGSNNTYAVDTVVNTPSEWPTKYLVATTNLSTSSVGSITKVEIGMEGRVSNIAVGAGFRPLFNGTATGTELQVTWLANNTDVTTYLDVTADAAGPGIGNWTWTDINNLDIATYGRNGNGARTFSVDQLYIRVTYDTVRPTGAFNSIAQQTNGSGAVDFSIEVNDADGGWSKARLEYEAGNSCMFLPPHQLTINTNPASTTADFGTPLIDNGSTYQIGTTTGWIKTASGTNSVFFDWDSKTDEPSADGVYCLRLTVNDGTYDQATSSIATTTLDNVSPTAPGQLSLATSSLGNGVVIGYGASSTDTNFKEYKIFYKQGTSSVTEQDTKLDKTTIAELGYSNFSGATSTTINDLLPLTDYVFNIWAYDQYGNESSSTEVSITTGKAAPVRANSVSFLVGQYSSSNGTVGQLSDTDYTLPDFDFSLAEKNAVIKNAYINFEAHFEAYANNAGAYTGYKLGFDACQKPCTPNAFTGTGAVVTDDNTVLAYDETSSNFVRLLLDVTSEAQLAAYSGDGGLLAGQVGYNIKRGSSTNSIAATKAQLVVTYQYNTNEIDSYTNTVVYPLESTVGTDIGSRRTVQADDCTQGTNCPRFRYNMNIPEFSHRLSQWFLTYNQNDGNAAADMNVNVNIPGPTNTSSDIYVHESAMGGTQGVTPVIFFSGVSGFAESTDQQLEYHATSPGATLTYFIVGGEVAETYTASSSASTKTRTVSFPLGIINNGLTLSRSNATTNVYFPENGLATGTVSIKKAWVRLITNNYNTAAANNTITVSSKVGNNAELAGVSYAYNPSNTVSKPSFNIIHVVTSTEYAELASANASTSKAVTVYTTNSNNTAQGGMSGELMITYTYTSETAGHLTSLDIFAGQSKIKGNATTTTSTASNVIAPEALNTKTLLAAGLLSSYLSSASNTAMIGGNLTFGASIATSAPVCVNEHNSRPDGVNEFTEFYKSVTSTLSLTNNQSLIACYSNSGTVANTVGAKMNGILKYVYKWDAPQPKFDQHNWRWYDNANSVTPGAARALEQFGVNNINLADTLRLRFNLGATNESLASSSQNFILQYGQGATCTAISTWYDVGSPADAVIWRGYDNSLVSSATTTGSALLSDSTVFETYQENNPSAFNPVAIPENGLAEWDWAIYNNGASSSASYCFRVVKSSGSLLDKYTSYPILTTAASNTAPTNASQLSQYRSDGITLIPNQSWLNQTSIRLVSEATDVNINESIGLFYQFITNGASYATSTARPSSYCVSGTTYASCTPKIWAVTSSIADYRTNAYVGTTSLLGLPEDYAGYKWQVLACDDSNACANWIKPGANPNVKIDLTAPTRPGKLTLSSRQASSLTIGFGATTTETNFDRYRIFYKKGTSSVTEADSEKSDANLLSITYNNVATTTVGSLASGNNYVFNIWAYDLAGNKASSSIELTASTTSSFSPPSGSFNTVAQKTDGSGGVDIAITASDPDNDDTLRAKIEYEAGATCAFATRTKLYIDPLDANTTAVYGDPKVDNNSAYQVGTTSGWILTSPGTNTVFFDWLSKVNIPNINATYCLRLTVNDGLFDQTTTSTKLILIDNFAPVAAGNLTLVSKNDKTVRLGFGLPGSDSNFDKYRIFYGTTSPVTENDTELVDGNLNDVNYFFASTTLVSGLLANTQYYFNIWAYDDFGNRASSTQLAVKTNALPYNLSNIGQYRSNGVTVVPNGSWTTENQIRLAAKAYDPDNPEQLTVYFEFIPTASSFRTATTVPTGACVYGTAYGSSCNSNVWFISTSTLGNYSVNPFVATTSITAIPESATGYKWQSLACDDDGNCTDWSAFNTTTPNVKVDFTKPTAPGAMTFNGKTSASVTLNLGATTTETNFDRYRIFYSTSTPVTTGGYEYIDTDLNYINYNNATMVTIPALNPNTQYYFNIWAYDLAGQSASSSEVAVTTNAVSSTPGVVFYTKNTRSLFYKVWDGLVWGNEQTGPTLGSAAGDNIRQLESIRSDDGGKIAVLAKTWDGTNQEWWATVYRYAANNFTTSTQLGAAYASANANNLISGCLGSLSSGEFFIIRNNNGNGTMIYDWSGVNGWVAQVDGPNPNAIVYGCKLTRRPGTDNYLLTTFDNTLDVGSSYYYGGSTYANNWTVWAEHSVNESNASNFVGDAFFDTGDNTRGAINYSDTTVNAYTQALNFTTSNNSIDYGTTPSSSPQAAGDSWATRFVQGKFAADPGSTGIAYFAGNDTSNQLNVYKVDITNGQPHWATSTNGKNISGGLLYPYGQFVQKPYDISYYKYYNGLVAYNLSTTNTPRYRKFNTLTNTIDAASSTVPGAASSTFTRIRLYDDPNEDELLAVYESRNVNYAAIFWNGASNAFYSSGNQAWKLLATSTGAFSFNDQNTTYSFTGRNSTPNTPTNLQQYKADASTTIANGAWTTQDQVYLKASATDPDTSEVITLYTELVDNGSSFTATTSQPTGACVWGTSYNGCTSKIWFVASSSAGDYSSVPFTQQVNITGIPNSASGYKWRTISCDDSAACANWVAFNTTQPNFKVDTTTPTRPGSLTVTGKTSDSITLKFGATTTETNFSTYKIFYKIGASGVTETSTEWTDSKLTNINFNNATSTTVTGLASSTQYVFNIWAYDLAGNKASSTSETATTTNSGPMIFQTSYLWESDDGANVNSSTPEAATSTALANIYKGERLNARIQIDNRGGDTASNKIYKLQYENQTDAAGTWVDVGANTEISNSLGLSGSDNDPINSAKASSSAGRIWVNGYWHEGNYSISGLSLAGNNYTEIVFAIKTGNALLGKTYRLRLYNTSDSRVLEGYTYYPTVTIVNSASDTKRYSKGLYPSLPSSITDLTYSLDPRGYANVTTDDANRDSLTAASEMPIYYFATKNATDTQAITTVWNGQSSVAASAANVILEVYRFAPVYAWVTVASNVTSTANNDFSLTATINSSLNQYYDASNWTYWRVYQLSGSETLRTDYFNTSFSAPVPEVRQKHYRWRANNGTESTASWLEAEDVGSPTASTTLAKGVPIRLRMSAANLGGGSSNYRYQIEYATTTSSCLSDRGSWFAIPTDNSRAFRMSTTTNFTDGASTTAQLVNSEGYVFSTGHMVRDVSNKTVSTTLAENQYTEIEYAFLATPNATDGATYCFRMTNSSTPLNSYEIYGELTLFGNPNTAPNWTVSPSDNGSATDTPTNLGDQVVFTATANDSEGDEYYLAICKTAGITAGNNGPPVCGGGNWCISNITSSTVEADCSYATATTSEVLPWFAYVCDKRPGVGVAKCILTPSQGGTGTNEDSPFNVNHPPTFSSISTVIPNQVPGSSYVITTVSQDSDLVGGADTLNLFVCKTNSANFAGCAGGGSDTLCQAIATSSPNASCGFSTSIPAASGTFPYYGFVFDSHNLAASPSYQTNSYMVTNVPPSLGTLILNGGNPITLNMKGATDTPIQAVMASVSDNNGCQNLISAAGTIYQSNVSGGYLCGADKNNCYYTNCVITNCTDASDLTATFTCTADFKYFANPTDNSNGNPNEPYSWLSYIKINDGSNLPLATSSPVELTTSQALNVTEDVINFGANLYVGQNTQNTNQPTTIVNAGNSPINTNLSGTDMAGNPAGTIPVNNIEYALSNFTWSAGSGLTNGGADVNTNIPKPTSTVDVYRRVYWGVGIPYGSPPSAYTGQNVFSAILNALGW